MSDTWLVQRWEGMRFEPGTPRGTWIDVMPEENDFGRKPAWEAVDPGGAFKAAVLDNKTQRLTTTSYRVMPYSGGATFSVGINVDAMGHGDE